MNFAQHLLIRLIGGYRWLMSPVLTALFSPGGLCRYSPSCSEYAQQAIQRHGVMAGSWFAVRRVCRCHPWGGCGHDPVPGDAPSGFAPFNDTPPKSGAGGLPVSSSACAPRMMATPRG